VVKFLREALVLWQAGRMLSEGLGYQRQCPSLGSWGVSKLHRRREQKRSTPSLHSRALPGFIMGSPMSCLHGDGRRCWVN
jgi:hypothetical protein